MTYHPLTRRCHQVERTSHTVSASRSLLLINLVIVYRSAFYRGGRVQDIPLTFSPAHPPRLPLEYSLKIFGLHSKASGRQKSYPRGVQGQSPGKGRARRFRPQKLK